MVAKAVAAAMKLHMVKTIPTGIRPGAQQFNIGSDGGGDPADGDDDDDWGDEESGEEDDLEEDDEEDGCEPAVVRRIK
eukprot:802876-Heterocapsa_arctica.AAC.1